MSTTLKRSISFPMLVLYGLGTTIGAGIYALVGELANVAGYLAPVSFLLASFMAGLTALSFAELSSRYPRCAGAALYVREGLRIKQLSTLVGLLVILAGLVSSAALVNGFVGYLGEFVTLERTTAIIIVVVIVGLIAAWGVAESVTIAGVVTLIEVGGLLIVIAVSHEAILSAPENISKLIPEFSASEAGLIFSGAVLAFYAFIGFEDMVDLAEETRNVERVMPLAIIATLVITTTLYILIMLAAVLSMSPDDLGKSEAPLALLYEFHTGNKATLVGVIGMFAIINGALIQVIMAARVLYGLSTRGEIPAIFKKINARTQTPVVATFAAVTVVFLLAIYGHLSGLASATSIIILAVFSIVNLSLIRIKLNGAAPENSVMFPLFVPVLGFIISAGFVLTGLYKVIF